MSDAGSLRDWVTGLFLVSGAFFLFVASLGVLRLPDVLIRMHALTKAGALGAGLTFVACAVHFGQVGSVSATLSGARPTGWVYLCRRPRMWTSGRESTSRTKPAAAIHRDSGGSPPPAVGSGGGRRSLIEQKARGTSSGAWCLGQGMVRRFVRSTHSWIESGTVLAMGVLRGIWQARPLIRPAKLNDCPAARDCEAARSGGTQGGGRFTRVAGS